MQAPTPSVQSPTLSPAITNTISNATTNIGNAVADATQTVRQSLTPFSSPQAVATTSQSFLESNSIIAKFVFLFLVVLVFLFLMNLGISLIGYWTQPANNPYIINGLISGTTTVTVPRDPKKGNAVTLLHSNNRPSGMEFTYSVWLSLQPNTNTNTQYSHIFSIGNSTFEQTTGIATVGNAPGVYLANFDISGNPASTANIRVVMDVVPNGDGQTFNQSMDVTNLPHNVWFNLILRMKNTILDVYVNGVITGRMNFTAVPKQNYGDVVVCGNGGFQGSLSNLRYYDYALNVFQIGGIVYSGPSTSVANVSGSSTAPLKNYNYLSSSWYAGKLA